MMEFSTTRSWDSGYVSVFLKSFLLWSFTLLVCMLVVGFPVVVLVATIGSLMAVVLQFILPASAVVLVSGVIFGGTLMGVFVASAMLTLRNIHPQEVTWLTWLHGKEEVAAESIYAACPLTCEVV